MKLDPPSRELEGEVSKIHVRYAGLLAFEVYEVTTKRLFWSDRVHFNKRSEELGYVIFVSANGAEGQPIGVAISVLEIGLPFELTNMIGTAASLASAARKPTGNALSL